MKKIGEKPRNLRKQRGLTMRQLAEILETFNRHISRIISLLIGYEK